MSETFYGEMEEDEGDEDYYEPSNRPPVAQAPPPARPAPRPTRPLAESRKQISQQVRVDNFLSANADLSIFGDWQSE